MNMEWRRQSGNGPGNTAVTSPAIRRRSLGTHEVSVRNPARRCHAQPRAAASISLILTAQAATQGVIIYHDPKFIIFTIQNKFTFIYLKLYITIIYFL
jgi:hypothetical protein